MCLRPLSFKYRVRRVASEAGLVGWNTVILEVRGGEVMQIIHAQALPPGRHGVAGNTELRLFGSFHVNLKSHGQTDRWKNEQGREGQNFPSSCGCYRRAKREQSDKKDRQADQNVQNHDGSAHHISFFILSWLLCGTPVEGFRVYSS